MVKLRIFQRNSPNPLPLQGRPVESSAPHSTNSSAAYATTKRKKAYKLSVISNSRKAAAAAASMRDSTMREKNVLDWVQTDAPADVVPLILTFCGPRIMDVLSLTCKSWRNIIMDDSVWRTACEGMHKWKEGDEIPESWLRHYCDNPIVPTDYSTVEAAWATACQAPVSADGTNISPTVGEQIRNIKIMVRPGNYVLHQQLVVHAIGSATVTLETLQTRQDLMAASSNNAPTTAVVTTRPNKPSLAKRLTCRSSSVVEEEDMAKDQLPSTNGRARLILQTRRHDEPIIRIRQGIFKMNHVDLVHRSPGMDIWNGNSAVQIQPPFLDDAPVRALPPSTLPMALLNQCDIMSYSGRGIVVIDGGHSTIRNCFVHDCAATGIYVGGQGSKAWVETTDVTKNGMGNVRSRRGIAPGHSGVYLEQGLAHISDCNISRNTLTGISAISTENATLVVEESDLVGNGTLQLEMPPEGSVSRQRSSSRGNLMSSRGFGRSRSGLWRPDDVSELLRRQQQRVANVPRGPRAVPVNQG